jgi:hypothetical protein
MNTCTQHSNARAAWRCTKCQNNLCPACAATDTIQGKEIIRCVSCRGIAEWLLSRKQIVPYWGMFGAFLLAIFSVSGLLQILGAALLMTVFAYVPIIGGLLALGVYASFYFLVIRRFAYGEETMPKPGDFSGLYDDILAPLLRFILATLLLWLPAFLYIRSQGFWVLLVINPMSVLHDPVLVLILVLSLLYFPAAIITAAVTENTLAMLNPLVILGLVLRIPVQYLVTMVVWGLMTVADLYLGAQIDRFLAEHAVVFVTPLLSAFFGLFIPVLNGMVLGRLCYQNGEELGFTTARELMVPELPGAKPKGTLPPEARAPAAAPPQAIELTPEPAAPGSPAEQLKVALQSGDNAGALQAFRALLSSGTAPDLEPALDLRLAGILEHAGESLAAAHACRRAAQKDMRGPLAARAIFTAARLLCERVGECTQGAAMYRYLIEHFPQDPLTERARELLRRLESQA